MKKISFTALLLWLTNVALADIPIDDDEDGIRETAEFLNSNYILWIGLVVVIIVAFVIMAVLKKRKANK
ncbi:MAG: hypothetical protein WBJ84_05840 [Bacteroidales bacterium]